MLDDGQLVVQPLAGHLRHPAKNGLQPLPAQLAQVRLWRLVGGNGEVRELDGVQLQVEGRAFGDFRRRRERARQFLKRLRHLLCRFEIELRRLAHAGFVSGVEVHVHLDAHQGVLRVGVTTLHIVHVVGGDHGQVQTARQFGHARDVLLLFGQPVRLDLEVEVSRTEDLPVLTGSLLGRGQIAAQDALGDLALQAARQGDEPAAVARQRVLVDARLVVEPVQVREGGELDEVAVALKIRCQQDEMKGVGVEFWIAV